MPSPYFLDLNNFNYDSKRIKITKVPKLVKINDNYFDLKIMYPFQNMLNKNVLN